MQRGRPVDEVTAKHPDGQGDGMGSVRVSHEGKIADHLIEKRFGLDCVTVSRLVGYIDVDVRMKWSIIDPAAVVISRLLNNPTIARDDRNLGDRFENRKRKFRRRKNVLGHIDRRPGITATNTPAERCFFRFNPPSRVSQLMTNTIDRQLNWSESPFFIPFEANR